MTFKNIMKRSDFDLLEELYSLKMDITEKADTHVAFKLLHDQEDLKATIRDYFTS